VINLAQVLFTGSGLVVLVGRFVLRSGGGGGSLLHAVGRCARLVLKLLVFLGLFGQVAKDVVEDEVAIGLLSKDKGLGESLMGLALIGDLADDLDDDVGIRALRVDVGNANLGVFVL
jgi:hypothetical protein